MLLVLVCAAQISGNQRIFFGPVNSTIGPKGASSPIKSFCYDGGRETPHAYTTYKSVHVDGRTSVKIGNRPPVSIQEALTSGDIFFEGKDFSSFIIKNNTPETVTVTSELPSLIGDIPGDKGNLIQALFQSASFNFSQLDLWSLTRLKDVNPSITDQTLVSVLQQATSEGAAVWFSNFIDKVSADTYFFNGQLLKVGELAKAIKALPGVTIRFGDNMTSQDIQGVIKTCQIQSVTSRGELLRFTTITNKTNDFTVDPDIKVIEGEEGRSIVFFTVSKKAGMLRGSGIIAGDVDIQITGVPNPSVPVVETTIKGVYQKMKVDDTANFAAELIPDLEKKGIKKSMVTATMSPIQILIIYPDRKEHLELYPATRYGD
jgi:hypothetical protein